MSPLQRAVAAVLIALLLAAGYGVWATRAPPAAAAPAQSGSSGMPVIDQSTFLTAQRLARLATTPEERSLAQAAVQTADHDLDLAFAAALAKTGCRQGVSERHLRVARASGKRGCGAADT